MRFVFHAVWTLVHKAVRSAEFMPSLAKLCHLFAGAAGVAAVALLFPDSGVPDAWGVIRAVSLMVVSVTLFLASVLFAQGEDHDHDLE